MPRQSKRAANDRSKSRHKPSSIAQTEKERRKRLEEIWAQLTWNQKRYVSIAHQHPDKVSAAKALGIKAKTMYEWPDIVTEAAELLTVDIVSFAKRQLTDAVMEAVLVKQEGMRDRRGKRIRQDASTEILDRVLGKPTQRQDITSKGAERMMFAFICIASLILLAALIWLGRPC